MTRHLFFTGEKGVGKSTLVELLLRRARGRVGGFRTRRVESLREGEATVHLLRAAQHLKPPLHVRLRRAAAGHGEAV